MFGTDVFLLVNFHILVTKNCGGVNDAKDFLLGEKKNGPKLPHYERNNSKVTVLDNRFEHITKIE